MRLNSRDIVRIAYAIVTIIAIGFSFSTLIKKDNQKQGILILKVWRMTTPNSKPLNHLQLPNLRVRGIGLPDSLQTIAEGVTPLLSSVVESAAGQASNAITSAVGSAESFVAQNLPKNLTIGTKYVCIDSSCTSFPFKGSDMLAEIGGPLGDVNDLLRRAPSPETLLATGTAAIGLALLIWLAIFRFPSALLAMLLCNLVGLALFGTSSYFVIQLSKLGFALSRISGIIAENGEVYSSSIVIVVGCSVAFLLGLVSWIFRAQSNIPKPSI